LWPPDGGRLCRRVVKGKVVKGKVQKVQRVVDCPSGVKVLRIDRPYGPEGS
jgi:hypothetical protein